MNNNLYQLADNNTTVTFIGISVLTVTDLRSAMPKDHFDVNKPFRLYEDDKYGSFIRYGGWGIIDIRKHLMWCGHCSCWLPIKNIFGKLGTKVCMHF